MPEIMEKVGKSRGLSVKKVGVRSWRRFVGNIVW